MSLNKYEQTLFDYIDRHTEERRFWHAKIQEVTRQPAEPVTIARGLEREMWTYYAERSEHVPALRQLNVDGMHRISLLNLAEHLLRLWGPPRPKKPVPPGTHAMG